MPNILSEDFFIQSVSLEYKQVRILGEYSYVLSKYVGVETERPKKYRIKNPQIHSC